MSWVRFTQDFDFSPAVLGGRSTVAYKAGMEANVTTECAAQAIEAGKAEGIGHENQERRPPEKKVTADAGRRKGRNPDGDRRKRR